MHKRVREREEGRKETEKQERRNERQKIGMKNCEEQLKEEKKHPHGSSGMSDRASSGKWELVLNKQTNKKYIKAQISTRTVTFFTAEPTASWTTHRSAPLGAPCSPAGRGCPAAPQRQPHVPAAGAPCLVRMCFSVSIHPHPPGSHVFNCPPLHPVWFALARAAVLSPPLCASRPAA